MERSCTISSVLGMNYFILIALFFLQLPPSPICPPGKHLDTECADEALGVKVAATISLNATYDAGVQAANNIADGQRGDCWEAYRPCEAAATSTGEHIACMTALEECYDAADAWLAQALARLAQERDAELAEIQAAYLDALAQCCEDD